MTNIVQLIRLGHTRDQIHIVVSRNIECEFEPLLDFITLACADDLEDEFDFNNKTQLNKDFRNGFWHYTSARIFVLHAYMKATGLINVVHIENDVLIYYHVNVALGNVPFKQAPGRAPSDSEATQLPPLPLAQAPSRAPSVPLESRKIYMPFDSYDRNVASIMYIPDSNILGRVLENYDYSKNDMYNFSKHCDTKHCDTKHCDIKHCDIKHCDTKHCDIKHCDIKHCDIKHCDTKHCDIKHRETGISLAAHEQSSLVTTLPICVPIPGMTQEQLWVSRIFDSPFIFDAAALGQMVGGVDPRNIGGDTRGFVNEECVIKYNDYGTIVWIDFKPYYRLHMKGIALERDIPIFNLHIHSKNLHLYSLP